MEKFKIEIKYPAGDGRGQARYRAGISKFTGEPLNLLNYAVNILFNIRGYAINEKYSQYQSSLSLINTFSKSSYYLGGEFKTEVTKNANKMYKSIVLDVIPYRETSYWTSDYGDIKCHLHKDTEAYKFLSSKTYKYGIEFGKFTNIAAPIVGNILTGYVVYKKYYTSVPNKYNNFYIPPKRINKDKIEKILSRLYSINDFNRMK